MTDYPADDDQRIALPIECSACGRVFPGDRAFEDHADATALEPIADEPWLAYKLRSEELRADRRMRDEDVCTGEPIRRRQHTLKFLDEDDVG